MFGNRPREYFHDNSRLNESCSRRHSIALPVLPETFVGFSLGTPARFHTIAVCGRQGQTAKPALLSWVKVGHYAEEPNVSQNRDSNAQIVVLKQTLFQPRGRHHSAGIFFSRVKPVEMYRYRMI
jgi:hypothetical protein